MFLMVNGLVPAKLDENVTDPLSLSVFAVRINSSTFVLTADRKVMLG